ncbi:MAG: reverse transcriptase-like protein [Firmicutes bacterium]|nr:reverse transcriptase-like protein [Bacillota bacterium]
MGNWVAHIDGGARGNPGPAAAAGVIRDESGRQTHLCAFLGVTTNNVAEYLALIWVLEPDFDSGRPFSAPRRAENAAMTPFLPGENEKAW